MFTRRNLFAGAGRAAPGAAMPVAADGTGDALPLPLTLTRRIAVRAVPTTEPVLAMTFDDGPHPSLTPALLDLLKARGIRATFYVTGRNAARHPDILRRMAGEGHEIGNHSWSHPSLAGLGRTALLRQIDRTAEAVDRAIGRGPATLRPPYGALTDPQRAMVLDRRGLPTILWSVDPEDWRQPGAEAVTDRILAGAAPGAIVVAHDVQPQTVAAMPATLDRLRDRGYGFATISALLGAADR